MRVPPQSNPINGASVARQLFDVNLASIINTNSSISVGAKLYFFESDGVTPAITYTTSDGMVQNANPMLVQADGRFAQQAWLDAGEYIYILTTPIGSPANPLFTGTFIALSLSSTSGAGEVGYDQSINYPTQTVGYNLQASKALTPADFAHLVTGGKVANGQNDTPAFSALAAAYFAGRAVHFPDLGQPYLIDPDTAIFTPPASYNATYRKPPYISADRSAIVRARSGGTFLFQLGTLASDYSGLLRNAEYELPTIDGYNFTFTKAPLYVPFFKDIQVAWTVKNAKRMAWFGDTTAPAASAGIKGPRNYERELNLWYRPVLSATNGVNPTITFAAPHPLWPSSGRRCVCINFGGAGWAAVSNRSLDALVLSATSIQLLNVDSTAYGAAGASSAYLNFESMRVAKQITGVTNANPCVVTTAIPHLLTSGDTVDLAEIGGMDPLPVVSRTGIQGQYTATVLTATTFSIPVDTTSTSTYGSYNGALGPGWMMPWVPLADCDIGEYHDNCTDVDLSNSFIQQVRLPIYHNPATSGYDGKYTDNHFYNFSEAGEILTTIYAGGDNHFAGNQVDGPFKYAFWFNADRNTGVGNKMNYGAIEGRDLYACMVRTNGGAGFFSLEAGLKATVSARMLKDHSGFGTYGCEDNKYQNVNQPVVSEGSRKIAASAVFSMINGSTVASFQTGATFARTGAGFANGDRVVTFLRPVPLTAYTDSGMPGGAANATLAATIEEDTGWAGRSVFQRRIITRVGGTPTDLNTVSVTWRYP